tara:strand:+ start:2507 stop:3280 length:774 start_codon:yes stop_codon:yes gene_type:complete
VPVRRRHTGPLYIQRALYPEDDGTAHLMLLHPPGGLVQGDRIDIDIETTDAASVLVTTPSAGKFYRTPATGTHQHVRLHAGPNSRLEWLPQEAILFDGADVALSLDVDLSADSRVIVWDSVVLGRPAIGERLTHGHLDTRLDVRLEARTIFSERTRVPGLADSCLQDARWGLDGAIAMGTLIAYRPETFVAQDIEALRELAVSCDGQYTVTLVDELLVVRALGQSSRFVRETLALAWHALRPRVMGKPAVAPRIWAT